MISTGGRSHRAWRIGGSIFTVVVLGYGTFDAVSALAHETLEAHQEYASAVRSIDVQSSNGSVRLVPTSGSAVIVDAVITKGLQTPSNDQTLTGDTLVIRGGCSFSLGPFCSTNYTIQVPKSSRVALKLSTSRGSIDIADVSADIMQLSASHGDVTARGIAADAVDASSSAGSVTLAFAQPPTRIDAHSSAGSVTIELPHTQDTYHVDVSSSAGSATAPIRTDPASPRVIRASSSAGDVTIRYSAS